MKKLLRSVVVGTLAVTSLVVATAAYFTSNVTAPGNVIQTGTLQAAIDSTNTTTNPTTVLPNGAGYLVAWDNNGTMVYGTHLPDITDMVPGDTRSVWFSVRNVKTSSAAFDYRVNFTGTWTTNPALDSGNMVTVSQVHRYQGGNCVGVVGCENIYYWLVNGYSYTNVGTVADLGGLTGAVSPTGTDYFGHANDDVADGVNTLAPNQFTIYRVDFTLNPLAGNGYKNQTLTYSVNLQTKQVGAPSFAP
jgi:predicted ribosomally synthesized peptide with SipW-like signal peptide